MSGTSRAHRSRCSIPAVHLTILFSLTLLGCGDDNGPSTPERVSAVEDFGFGLVPELTVDTFAGDITIVPVPSLGIHVVATKWARSENDLELIQVLHAETDDASQVAALNPSEIDNASVNFEISLPVGRTLDIYTGSGQIAYTGTFAGDGDFRADGGLIVFRIPEGTQIRLDLEVGVGVVTVDFDVDGDVSTRRVSGKIGHGREGVIRASVGFGNIQILKQ